MLGSEFLSAIEATAGASKTIEVGIHGRRLALFLLNEAREYQRPFDHHIKRSIPEHILSVEGSGAYLRGFDMTYSFTATYKHPIDNVLTFQFDLTEFEVCQVLQAFDMKDPHIKSMAEGVIDHLLSDGRPDKAKTLDFFVITNGGQPHPRILRRDLHRPGVI